LENPERPSPAVETAQQAREQAAGVVSTAAGQTGQVASTAAEGGKWVAATAQEGTKEVVSTAVDQVAQVAEEVTTQARNLIDESKNQLRSQATSQTQQIASSLRQVGDQVQALVEGRTEEAGPVADYARQAAQAVNRWASQIDERGYEGVITDVQRFARRRPGTFLLGAAIAGFGVGRLIRQANALNGQDQPQPQQPAYDPMTTGFQGMPLSPPPMDVPAASVAAMNSIDDVRIAAEPVSPATPSAPSVPSVPSPAATDPDPTSPLLRVPQDPSGVST
jgi:vacuolar-type H+-ATPase subunit H